MEKYACPKCELSCIIGNLFTQVEPPCASGVNGGTVICGTTLSGAYGVLIIEEDTFFFVGNQDDLAAVRNSTCLNRRGCPFAVGGEHG